MPIADNAKFPAHQKTSYANKPQRYSEIAGGGWLMSCVSARQIPVPIVSDASTRASPCGARTEDMCLTFNTKVRNPYCFSANFEIEQRPKFILTQAENHYLS